MHAPTFLCLYGLPLMMNKSSKEEKKKGRKNICEHQHQCFRHSVIDVSVHSLLALSERSHRDRQALTLYPWRKTLKGMDTVYAYTKQTVHCPT